jgi:hypothetical protein
MFHFELFPALHFIPIIIGTSKKLFFQALKGASMVALLGQEKIRFFDSVPIAIAIPLRSGLLHLVLNRKFFYKDEVLFPLKM